MKVEPEDHFFPIKFLARGGFVEAGIHPVTAEQQVIHVDVHLVGVEDRAGITRRADDAAPIGITSRHGCLDQR